ATERVYYDLSKRLILNIQENFSTSPRAGAITVYCPDLDSTIIITILQDAHPNTLLTDRTTVRISSSQGSVSFLNLKSNISWKMEGNTPSWLSINRTFGDTSTLITFTATEDNENGIDRSANLILSGNGVDTIVLTVIQSFEELYFYTDKSIVRLENTVRSMDTVRITSNTDWVIRGYDTALVSVIPQSGFGNAKIVVTTLQANNNYFLNQTAAHISTNGSVSADIAISQKAVNHLVLPETNFELGAAVGSTVKVQIYTNMTWYFQSSTVAPWLTSDINGSNDSSEVTFTALEANNTGNTRTANYKPRTTSIIRNVYITQTTPVSSTEFEENKSVVISPNPAADMLSVISSKEIKRIQLISITGKVLKTIFPNKTYAEIDVSDLASGIYFTKIISADNSIITKKIAKQ
ncbi:MAG: T9SS type A sorting domain-containing protein, partial [Bacteroidales bacterium]|nr:T9SS type A sorting domain-containing protein [Bacteroidales bacterium]